VFHSSLPAYHGTARFASGVFQRHGRKKPGKNGGIPLEPRGKFWYNGTTLYEKPVFIDEKEETIHHGLSKGI
jgi:hypothetical protein